MSVLGRVMAGWQAPAVSDDGHWHTRGGGVGVASSAGVLVTEQVALTNPVVFDCNRILCDAVGLSPAILYERAGDDETERQRARTRLAYRLREQPNDEQTAFEFKVEMQQAANFYKYAYAEITWDPSMTEPVNIVPRHPTRVRRMRADGGRQKYEYFEDDGRTWRPILPSNMLRVPGRDVLRHAGETLGHAIALERYSARLFGRSPKPSTAVKAEKGVTYDERQRADIKRMLMEHAGEGSGGVVWIPEGLDVQPYGMTNEQAQYAELRNSIVGDIARWWRIPPYMLGLLESGTVSYASVNTQSVDFVVYCLMPWLVGWEQAMQRDLIVEKDRQFVEFLTASLLRGTTRERYDVYQIALSTTDPATGMPIMTVDEIRRLENLNPHTGRVDLDRLAMVPPGAAAHAEAGSPADRLLQAFAADAAGRVLRREQGALATIAKRAGDDGHTWEQGVAAFYGEVHPRFVSEALKVPLGVAMAYSATQKHEILTEGPAAAAAWNGSHTDRLVQLALTAGAREVAG
jgi:HK97 family phage portal protein